jgi:hypothetical protein
MFTRRFGWLRWVVPAVFAASLLVLFLPLQLSGKVENALGIGGFVGVVASLLLMSYGTIEQLRDAWLKRRPVFWFYMRPEPVMENRGNEGLKALTLFRNLSRVPIKMYVNLQPSIYGRRASSESVGTKYTGKEFVLLGPEDNMNGIFSISRLLAENGEDAESMREKSTADNRTTQLRLSIKISCEDQHGASFVEPEEIYYYFDFARGKNGVWVYDG